MAKRKAFEVEPEKADKGITMMLSMAGSLTMSMLI